MRTRARFARLLLLVSTSLLVAGSAAAQTENIDPDGDGHQYAWGENIGWLNAEPDGGNGTQVADFALTGWMWAENIGWVSLSCTNTSVCGATPYGVANDGAGQLSGFAWSENAGWVNFAPSTCAGDPTCGVKIDPATGYFSGRAWSENDGWITFSSGPPETWTVRSSWCQGFSGPPGLVTALKLGKTGTEVVLSWAAPPLVVRRRRGTAFDVAGERRELRSSHQALYREPDSGNVRRGSGNAASRRRRLVRGAQLELPWTCQLRRRHALAVGKPGRRDRRVAARLSLRRETPRA